jgi:hypothetical protein
MSEQSLPRTWLNRSVSVILTIVVVAGALAFALS